MKCSVNVLTEVWRWSQGPLSQHMGRGDTEGTSGCNVDHEALAQGHVNVITGACMAIGVKVISASHQ